MFWMREIVGWLLILLGLAAFLMVFVFVSNRRYVEGTPMTFTAFVLFRGGIHLVKVATAARLSRDPYLGETPKPAAKAGPRVLQLPGSRPDGADPARDALKRPATADPRKGIPLKGRGA